MSAVFPTPRAQPATGSSSPPMRRASAAQTASVSATRSISPRPSLTGLPSSTASWVASWSRRSAASRAARSRTSARAAGATRATARAAAGAYRTARVTSAEVAVTARVTTRRRYGPTRSAVGPSSIHSPATSAGAEVISSRTSSGPPNGAIEPLYGLGVTYVPAAGSGNRDRRESYVDVWQALRGRPDPGEAPLLESPWGTPDLESEAHMAAATQRSRQQAGDAADAQGVRSIRRALDILSLLTDDKPVVSVRDITDATSLPKTTVLRLVHTLEQSGLLWATAGGYMAGPGLWRWAYLARRSWQLPPETQATMRDLGAKHQETVNLYVLRDICRVCVAQQESPQGAAARRPGGRRAAAVGRCVVQGPA